MNDSANFKFMTYGLMHTIVMHSSDIQNFKSCINAVFARNAVLPIDLHLSDTRIEVERDSFLIQLDVIYPAVINQADDTTISSIALAIALSNGVSSEHLNYIVDTITLQSAPQPVNLCHLLQTGLSGLKPNIFISRSLPNNMSDKFLSLIKRDPKSFCWQHFDFTNLATQIPYLANIIVACDMSFNCDDQTAKKSISSYLNLSASFCNDSVPRLISAEQNLVYHARRYKEPYINAYLRYYHNCHRILSNWLPTGAKTLPSEIVFHIMSCLDQIPLPDTVINSPVHNSTQLRMGGELHNLMITTVISKHYHNSNLQPSFSESMRWKCIIAAIINCSGSCDNERTAS